MKSRNLSDRYGPRNFQTILFLITYSDASLGMLSKYVEHGKEEGGTKSSLKTNRAQSS